MRWQGWISRCGLVLLTILLISKAFTLQGQESDETFIFHYENEHPNQLDVVLLQSNICLEAVLRLNPGLDINHISYGQPLRLPVDEPCYEYDKTIDGWWNFSDGKPPRLKYYENGQWLTHPYYSDHVVYLNAESVEEIAYHYNLCVDVLLAENVLLQQFDAYKVYAFRSLDVFLPRKPQSCDPNWTPPADRITAAQIELPADIVTPLYFVNEYNICPEEFPQLGWNDTLYQRPASNSFLTFTIPEDVLPCYNDQGQRLRYYDKQGRPREEPRYTDLKVYVTLPGETMSNIASHMGVCLIDLLRVNHFAQLPAIVPIELFIPPARPCPEDVEARLIDGELNSLSTVSRHFNICPGVLKALNPHFYQTDDYLYYSHYRELPAQIYKTKLLDGWVLFPKNPEPCYWEFHPQAGDSIFGLERNLNVCYQEFRWQWHAPFFLDTSISHDQVTIHIPHQVQPCYNDQGQRLYYPTAYSQRRNSQTQFTDLHYADMPVYSFQRSDTVYSVSRQYNVCVHELLKVNPLLAEAMPTGYPTFIPQTRPCYDEATGMPLIYEDAQGRPLPQPKVGDHLIYYGGQSLERLSSYYNVCVNRIEDANRAKLERQSSYLGWIIPTDRPHCYDQDGNPIDYVCYAQPVDFAVDYGEADQAVSLDYDGTYCYDLANSETVVWYQNKPYQVIEYNTDYKTSMLTSRAFTAWCYGVSLEEIDAINDNPDILSILPFQARAIPQPSRDCYLQQPDLLSGQQVHTVQYGETLSTIARQYNKAPGWIAKMNDLDEDSSIWQNQKLIIPSDTTLAAWLLLNNSLGVVAACVVGIIYWLKHRREQFRQKHEPIDNAP